MNVDSQFNSPKEITKIVVRLDFFTEIRAKPEASNVTVLSHDGRAQRLFSHPVLFYPPPLFLSVSFCVILFIVSNNEIRSILR